MVMQGEHSIYLLYPLDWKFNENVLKSLKGEFIFFLYYIFFFVLQLNILEFHSW